MTIAEQIAHDFLDSVEKNIVANKLDIKSLEKNISYSSKDEVKMEVADEKTGVVIATMRLNVNTNKLKREMQEKELENYCRKRICPICIFKGQEPCIMRKIKYGTTTSEEVEESYRKALGDKK